MHHHDELLQEDRRKFRDRRIPPPLLPVLAGMKVRVIPEPYLVVAVASKHGPALQRLLAKNKKLPFSSVSVDDREATVVLPAELWKTVSADYPGAEIERNFRVLAIEGEADWGRPGFLPVLGRALAEGNIGAGMITGFRRLHLLVKARHVKDTRVFLDLLSSQARGRLQKS